MVVIISKACRRNYLMLAFLVGLHWISKTFECLTRVCYMKVSVDREVEELRVSCSMTCIHR
jgi:hypothetical protein